MRIHEQILSIPTIFDGNSQKFAGKFVRVIHEFTLDVLHVVVSCGYDTCFAVRAFDGLCLLSKSMDREYRFWESLVIRLHSEIDQIHLSIEAQCGTARLPLGDCHITITMLYQN